MPSLLIPDQGPDSQHFWPSDALGFQSIPVQLVFLTHAALQASTDKALLTLPSSTWVFRVTFHDVEQLPATPHFNVYQNMSAKIDELQIHVVRRHHAVLEGRCVARFPNRKGTCYSAAYTWTRDQKRFTISEVAADWHELMIPQRFMWPSIARASEQLDPRCSTQTYHRPNQPH